jgi:hypothetical protein
MPIVPGIGVPVVGTRIPSLEDFASILSLAATPADWSAAIAAALEPAANTVDRCGARQAVAREYDWALHVGDDVLPPTDSVAGRAMSPEAAA